MNTTVDYLIIGAGPAGLQLAYFFEKRGRDYLILEKADTAGAFFKTMPRHRLLISINKVYTGKDDPVVNMRWDWNSLITDNEELLFKNYSMKYFPNPDSLVQNLEDYAAYYDFNIRYNTMVDKVAKQDDHFVVTDSEGNQFMGKRLVIATGIYKPYVPADIPGAEMCETYNSHIVDPEYYRNKRVLVVGKGNSAFETADNLIETTAAIHIVSPEPVKFAWQSHYVGHLRAINNNFLDTYQLKSQNTVIDAAVEKIEKKDDKFMVEFAFTHAMGQKMTVPYDHVIFCTGFRHDTSFYDESCMPELVHCDKFPAQTGEWESVNIPGLYYAGSLMQACDFKKTMSGFIHGFRHNVESLANVFEIKYEGSEWPHETVDANAETVTEKLIERVNRSPGIFLQPGFLNDVIVVDDEKGTATFYPDIRKDYVSESIFGQNDHYYTISLEYGHFDGDPFNVERDPSMDAAAEAVYLHPVIRRYSFGKMVNEYHIQDDLESEWHKPEFIEPTIAYFKKQLMMAGEPAMAMD